MSTNVYTVGPLSKKLFLYLFKLTSICTDARTEEAHVRKSYRAEFKLELSKLTFDTSKIILLSTSKATFPRQLCEGRTRVDVTMHGETVRVEVQSET